MPVQEGSSNRGRRIRALCGLAALAALFAALPALPLSLPFLAEHRAGFKRLHARWVGARFVGDEGVILQSHGNDCAVAALRMILASRGIQRPPADLASRLRLSAGGASMLDLRIAAAGLGLPARSWGIQPADLGRVPLPAIAFVNRDHFVVIRRFASPGVLEVDDPALGRLLWPVRAFRKVWSGETLVFDPAWAPH